MSHNVAMCGSASYWLQRNVRLFVNFRITRWAKFWVRQCNVRIFWGEKINSCTNFKKANIITIIIKLYYLLLLTKIYYVVFTTLSRFALCLFTKLDYLSLLDFVWTSANITNIRRQYDEPVRLSLKLILWRNATKITGIYNVMEFHNKARSACI
jgi:hypothetical protein